MSYDGVEARLEEAVPQLRTAFKLKLLNTREIRTIVKKRRDHEHALLRPLATRQHFLRYAAFEKDVLSLLQKRATTKRLKRARTATLVRSSRRNVDSVYQRAVKHFPADARLWVHFARHFVNIGLKKNAERVLAQAIAMCSSNEDVWLAAIAYHFDTCNDARTARVIAQRALRNLPDASTLWLEHFRVELFFLARLCTRRLAMGVTTLDDVDESQSQAAPTDQSAAQTDKSLSFWQGGAPLAVLKGALAKCTFTPAHRAQLYAVATECRLVPSQLLRKIVEVLQRAYPTCALTQFLDGRVKWDVAKADLDRADAIKRSANSFSKGVDAEVDGDADTSEHDEMCAALACEGGEVAVELADLLRAEGSWKGDEGVTTALRICADNLRGLVNDMKQLEGKDVEPFDNLSTVIENSASTVNKESDQGNGVENGRSQGQRWSVESLGDYLRKGHDELGVSHEDVSIHVRKLCLVPFRNDEQDRVLCLYLRSEVDLTRLRETYQRMLSLPPVTLSSLSAAVESLISIVELSTNLSQELMKEVIREGRKMLAKGSALLEAKKDVVFWLTHVDFERRIARDAVLAADANEKATRVLDMSLRDNFVERLTLRTLT